MAAILDIFPYNGEHVLKLRLDYLKDVVTKFYVVESRYTHSGVLKPFLHVEKNGALFAQYKNVEIVVIDEFPPTSAEWMRDNRNVDYMKAGSHDSWFREQYQRQYGVEHAMKRMQGQRYVIICSDCDEIPNVDVVARLGASYSLLDKPVYLEMKMLYYNFDWVKRYLWHSAFVINDAGLVNKPDISYFRVLAQKSSVIQNAGWHLSFFGSVADLGKKLESFAHQEFNDDKYKREQHVMDCIKYGRDLFLRPGEDLVPMEGDLPSGWQELQKALVWMQSF